MVVAALHAFYPGLLPILQACLSRLQERTYPTFPQTFTLINQVNDLRHLLEPGTLVILPQGERREVLPKLAIDELLGFGAFSIFLLYLLLWRWGYKFGKRLVLLL